jgi:hypothetical protein
MDRPVYRNAIVVGFGLWISPFCCPPVTLNLMMPEKSSRSHEPRKNLRRSPPCRDAAAKARRRRPDSIHAADTCRPCNPTPSAPSSTTLSPARSVTMGMGMGGVRGGAGSWVPGERWRRALFLALASVSFLLSLILLFLSAPRLRLPSLAPSVNAAASAVRRGPDAPPCLAYLLTGRRGDGRRLLRLLLAVYHPRNRYVLHLSADASDDERRSLASRVAAAAPAVGAFGNVAVVGTPTAGTPVGASGLAGTLRAAALLLRLHPDWDWFLTLNAADYPLVTQDGKPARLPFRGGETNSFSIFFHKF